MTTPRAKVVFMGSPDFAVPTLAALAGVDAFEVACVVTQPDRPKGRGKQAQPTAVKSLALERELPVRTMDKTGYADVVEHIRGLAPDFVVVAAFGMILRQDLLSMPPHGCINLHASLLPRHRGMSPIQAAILAGDAETGCTTMRMDAGVDTGDMLLTARTAIRPDDTAGTLEARLARIGAPLVLDTLSGMLDGRVEPVRQDDDEATYARRIRKSHGAIDWSQPADAIWRRVRAMTPWPSAYAMWGERRVIILASRPGDGGASGEPGRVVSVSPLEVQTGAGILTLERLKVAGKREMAAEAFVAGYRVRVGDRFAPGAPA